MPAKSILVVEDDPAIRRGVSDALTFAGYEVLTAATGQEGLARALTATIDLILLDLVLPGPSGFAIVKAVREARPTLPVIMLTARGEEADRVQGLQLGCDDYVVKPFSVKELLARVEAVLRRSPERPGHIQHIPLKAGMADLARCEVRFDDGVRHELSEREVALLGYLAAHRGRVVTREEILSRIWRLDPKGRETRTIDVHIANRRQMRRAGSERRRVGNGGLDRAGPRHVKA